MEASKLKYLNDNLEKAAEDGAVFIKVTEKNEQPTSGADDSKFLQLHEGVDKSFELTDDGDDADNNNGLGQHGVANTYTPIKTHNQTDDLFEDDDIKITRDRKTWANFFKSKKFQQFYIAGSNRNIEIFKKLSLYIEDACLAFNETSDFMNFYSLLEIQTSGKLPVSNRKRDHHGYTWKFTKDGGISQQYVVRIDFNKDDVNNDNFGVSNVSMMNGLDIVDIFQIILFNYAMTKKNEPDNDFLKVVNIKTLSISSIKGVEIIPGRDDKPHNVMYINTSLRFPSVERKEVKWGTEIKLFAEYLKETFPKHSFHYYGNEPIFLYISGPKKLIDDVKS